MQIEKGKSYRTRDGRKVGPMHWYCPRNRRENVMSAPYPFDSFYWRTNGVLGAGNSKGSILPALDLVAEWSDGPVRGVTRRKIVPGVYGPVEVVVQYQDKVVLNFRTKSGVRAHPAFNADELEVAANTLLELAGALRDA